MKNLTINELAATGNKFAVVAFDETNNWRTSIKKKAGTIEGVYLLILDEPTYCCEITPSYYGVFLRNFFESTEGFDEDELTEMERDNGGVDEGSYFNCYSTPKLIKFYAEGELEDIEEYEMCNPSYC